MPGQNAGAQKIQANTVCGYQFVGIPILMVDSGNSRSNRENHMGKAESNPKQHDNIFKWLLVAFIDDFFDFFFHDLDIQDIEIIDKEFVNTYEALKESLRGDLFLVVDVLLNGQRQDIVILIEIQSRRADLSRRLHEYTCYAALLRRRPVWCIALFSDDNIWRTRPPDRFPFAYSSKTGMIEIPYDIIKLKDYESAGLMRQRSLLLKLLALKANDAGCCRKTLVREIYQAAAENEHELTNEQRILIERFVSYYAALPEEAVDQIKKEVEMTFVATTLTEHLLHEGEKRGTIKGAMNNLQELYNLGVVPEDIYQARMTSLKQQLEALEQEIRELTQNEDGEDDEDDNT